MKHNWIPTKISEFVQQTDNVVDVQPNEKYTLLGMSLEGRGLFIREEKLGIEIGSKTLNKVIPGEFIYSRLFAWKGAFDYVKDEFDGTYVSDEYPTFIVDDQKADVKFLHYYFNQSRVWKEVEEYCIGVTKASRNRFKEKYFLELSIPLPPLTEQRRIVSKIEAVISRIKEISNIRSAQKKELANLNFSVFCDVDNDFEKQSFGSFLIPSKNVEVPHPEKKYRQVGVKWWGEGAYERETIEGSQTAYNYFTRLEKNNFLFNKIWVRHGALAIVKENTIGCYASGEFPVYSFDEQHVNPSWIDFVIQLPNFWEKCSKLSQGTSGKNRIRPEEFLKMEIPLPPIEDQNRIVLMLEKLNELKDHHLKTQKELAQLMPSLLNKVFKESL